MKDLLNKIISSDPLHAKWLNTLSYLENCGARKIAACEHPTLVKEEMLKHAAEEFRHAHHLKRQINKISSTPFEDYQQLLGGNASRNYLHSLDIQTSRYLKAQGLPPQTLKEAAYLLVTYAIELRAEFLYPLYEEALRTACSRITVKSILLEEKEHLQEMREGLEALPSGLLYAQQVTFFENTLFRSWLEKIKIEIS